MSLAVGHSRTRYISMVNKQRYQTARVHWQMGQALLPEHFYAQEHGLRQEQHQRFQMGAAPCWGVAQLKWDSFQILQGIVSIQELVLIMPSGALVDVPGNSHPASFNLNSSGSARAVVYVHLESGYDVTSEGEGSAGEESIERVVQRISLSAVPYLDTAQQSFRLAEFDKSIDGDWTLNQDYIPPMMRIGPAPFFDGILSRMRTMGAHFREVLAGEIQQKYLGGESQLAAKQCMRTVFGYINVLANIGQEIQPHPYELFCVLRDFYLDVCVYRDCQPKDLALTYRHDGIGEVFHSLLAWAEDQIHRTRSETPYAVFEVQEGRRVCELPDGARRAKDVYWLVQRHQVAQPVEIAGLKLAAPSRTDLVHQRALRGIPYRAMERPPFQHSFSSEVEFFCLTPGQEWDHAVREGRVAFFDRPELADTRFFIYWRHD